MSPIESNSVFARELLKPLLKEIIVKGNSVLHELEKKIKPVATCETCKKES